MSRDREAVARTAAEAFEVLGNEIRTAMVLELADAGPLSFSELRERVGVTDSGRFNYHLEKLVGRFVR
jgi:DNA-binding HxlR family transcriptional regulator